MFLLLLFSSQTITSQVLNSKWQWLHPKPQGNVLRWCKMWDANTWYAAGNFGTFMKTSNAGVNWVITYEAGRYFSGRNSDVWDAHFINQNSGILVGINSSARVTTNGGNTFDSIPDLILLNTDWYRTFFLDDNTGYIVGNNTQFNEGKVAKTINGGGNWALLNVTSTGAYTDFFTFDNNYLFICTGSGIVRKSPDGGVSWSDVTLTSNSNSLFKFCFLNRDTGFVCGAWGNVFLTTNNGLNWIIRNSGLPVSQYKDIDYKLNGNISEVYLTGDPYYIYKSTDLGLSWDTVRFWGNNQTYMGLNQLYTSTDLGGGDTLLTVGTYSLINKRNNDLNTSLNSDFIKFGPNGLLSDIWISNSKIWAVGSPTSQGVLFDQILYSSNSGSNWVKQDVGSSTSSYTSIYMVNESTGFTVGTSGSILKTINGGTNWNAVTSPTSYDLLKTEFVNENTGWVFGGGSGYPITYPSVIYKTTNSGSTWVSQTLQGLMDSSTVVNADMLDENTGWLLQIRKEPYGMIYKTTNGGLNWSANSPISYVLYGIKMIDNNTGYVCGEHQVIRKTTNGGDDWQELTVPLTFGNYTSLDFTSADIGMVLHLSNNTIRTTNGGASWLIENVGTQTGNWFGGNISAIKMTSNDVAYIAGNFASVLKYNTNPIGIIEWESQVPKKFMLYQNFPNPFNPSTTIKFAIPKTGSVTLKVYDITGREVRTIINNMQLNAGTITHSFDGSELASGIYFYSLLVNGSLVETKKMILVK